ADANITGDIKYTLTATGTCESDNISGTITIKKKVVIGTQPQNLGICASQTATFGVYDITGDFEGSGYDYQWYKVASPTDIAISGAKSNKLTITNTNYIDDDGQYYVIITGSNVCEPIQSNTVSLNVNQDITINTQPQSKTVCQDNDATLSVTASGSIAKIEWYQIVNNNDFNSSSENDDILVQSEAITENSPVTNTYSPNTENAGKIEYYALISTTGGYCDEIITDIVSVEVIVTPKATLNYADITYCNSQDLTVKPTEFDSNYLADGQFKVLYDNGVDTPTEVSDFITNSNTGEFNPKEKAAGTYSITYDIPNQGPCSGVTTTAIEIEIEEQPEATISYAATEFCTSDLPAAITSSQLTNGINTYSYEKVGPDSDSGVLTLNADGTIASGSEPGTYKITYSYTPDSGNCSTTTADVTIIIKSLKDADFNYLNDATDPSSVSSAFCNSGGSIASINFTDSETSSEHGTFTVVPKSGSPSDGLVIDGTGNIDAGASSPGTYDVTFTIDGTKYCAGAPHTTTITIDPISVGGTVAGYDEFDEATISNNIIACHNGSGKLTVSGYTGTVIGWQSSTNGGLNWTDVSSNPAPDEEYEFNYTGIIETAAYRAVIQSGSCGLAYSQRAIISVIPPDIKPTPVTVNIDRVCIGQPIEFSAESGFGTGGGLIQNGDFQSAQPEGWLSNGQEKEMPSGNSNAKTNPWALAAPKKSYGGTVYDSDGKFAVVNGVQPIYNGIPGATLETPVFNTIGLSTATFEFYMAYVLESGASLAIDLSLDGGTTYGINLETFTGPTSWGNPLGLTQFSLDLNSYIGQPQLRLKFTFIGTDGSSAALDNFVLPDQPYGEEFEWVEVDESNNETIITITSDEEFTLDTSDLEPGEHTFYATSYINGCRSTIAAGGFTPVTFWVYEQETAEATGKIFADVECGINTFELTGNTPTMDEYHATGGIWTITPASGFTDPVLISSDSSTYPDPFTDPNAILVGDPGATYDLTWTMTQSTNHPCTPTSADIQVVFLTCDDLDFDGTDDHVVFGDTYNFTGNFTIETWVRRTKNTYPQTVISKRNGNDTSSGYDLSFNTDGSHISFNYNNSSVTSEYPNNTLWHHVAVTYDGNYNIYVDGILGSSGGSDAPTSNTADNLLGTHHVVGDIPEECFGGKLDELRYWSTALTQEQIQEMMNQEVNNSGSLINGNVLQTDIAGLSSSNLIGYYQLNTSSEISGGYLQSTGVGTPGLLKNITSTLADNAPLPFQTANGGSWDTSSTWLNGDVQYIPNSAGIKGESIDWNIVRTSHNVNSHNDNITLLGLLINSGSEITISNPNMTQDEYNSGNALWVTHYLKLNGQIDLIGESQLIQKRYSENQLNDSELDPTSTGFIERDQQGTANLYNYNYWSSPVSGIGSNVAINANYTVANVLMNGATSANPGSISWIGGYDASPGPPLSMCNYWILTYNAISNTYLEWKRVGSTGTIPTGNGYTMKGSGSGTGTDEQNYVFKGKPHNGLIQNANTAVSHGNEILIGNPYPSALDADEFIKDNIPDALATAEGSTANPESTNAIDGALYFWIHYFSSNSHYLADYEGGYAIYNLSGGEIPSTPPITVDGYEISELGSSNLMPGRYIPVGQGFFVGALETGTGGQIKFENDQRVFKRESGSGTSIFLKSENSETTSLSNDENESVIKRVRITASTPNNLNRHLLLAFVENGTATDAFDYGYDAKNIDLYSTDVSWNIDGANFVIQGVGDFDTTKQYPLNIVLSNKGNIDISLRVLENFEDDIDVFIYDSVTGGYTQFNNVPFSINLDAGEYNGRFFLTFTDDDKLDVIEDELQDITINYLDNTDEIHIRTPSHISLKQVNLINTLGQTVKAWNATNAPLSNNCKIPVKNISEGNYIVTVKTENGSISKKVIVQF
ncbi:LamG-like jellyroll fold domain-containing protein, partial [Formosa sp. S-31]|uniref:LamG-like jellyroll fold domain-containing protein n=1 Tax=Formosa sp. S-31 TaxID=2790949 RepID=UPI003EBFC353